MLRFGGIGQTEVFTRDIQVTKQLNRKKLTSKIDNTKLKREFKKMTFKRVYKEQKWQ